jgi:aryl-alcohol dehydrogenase-like predicted oxidoreductase
VNRRLGPAGPWVSPWCLGCNPFGWTTDERQSFAVLDEYVAHGGNFVDTADSYPPGSKGGISEEIVGRWLRARRNRADVVLATKVGSALPSMPAGLSAAAIRRRFDASLRRLGVDHVDLLYAHLDDPDVPLEESLGALDELVRSGRARAIAASNYSAPRLAKALDVSRRGGLARYVAVQTHYNLLERDRILGERINLSAPYEGRLQDLCVDEDVAVVAYWVLAKGYLTGKYAPGSHGGAAGDFSDRARVHDPASYGDDGGRAVVGALREIARAHDATPAAVAIAWALAQPGITATVVSARTPEQVVQLGAAMAFELSGGELERLANVSARTSPRSARAQ